MPSERNEQVISAALKHGIHGKGPLLALKKAVAERKGQIVTSLGIDPMAQDQSAPLATKRFDMTSGPRGPLAPGAKARGPLAPQPKSKGPLAPSGDLVQPPPNLSPVEREIVRALQRPVR